MLAGFGLGQVSEPVVEGIRYVPGKGIRSLSRAGSWRTAAQKNHNNILTLKRHFHRFTAATRGTVVAERICITEQRGGGS